MSKDGYVPDTAANRSEVAAYDAYRRQIEAEDALIGTRVGWFIASEAFLFAAYGAVLAVQQRSVFRSTLPIDRRLFDAVPIVGIMVAVLVGSGIGAAMHQMRVLSVGYSEDGHPPGFPRIWAKRYIVFFGHVTAALIAPVVILSWVFVWVGSDWLLISIPIVLLSCFAFYLLHITLTEYARLHASGVDPELLRHVLTQCFRTAWRERLENLGTLYAAFVKSGSSANPSDLARPVKTDDALSSERQLGTLGTLPDA